MIVMVVRTTRRPSLSLTEMIAQVRFRSLLLCYRSNELLGFILDGKETDSDKVKVDICGTKDGK